MKPYIFAAFSLVILSTSQTVLAHPGHIGDHGAGHNHWLALVIFSGLALAILGYALSKLYKRSKLSSDDNTSSSRLNFK